MKVETERRWQAWRMCERDRRMRLEVEDGCENIPSRNSGVWVAGRVRTSRGEKSSAEEEQDYWRREPTWLVRLGRGWR